MSEQWVHYSSDPTQIVMYDADQCRKTDNRGLFKPVGLWITPYGQEDNWFEWSMAEDFRISELNYIHEVTLAKDASILRISSEDELDAFSMEYAIDIFADKKDAFYSNGEQMQSWMYCDWPRLAEKYQGVLISPYQYGRRLMRHGEDGGRTRSDWYYSWDCASGCIWSADAIESIKLRSELSAGYVSKPIPSLASMTAMLREGVGLLAPPQEDNS